MKIIILSVLAGVAGTGLGGLLTALLGNKSDKLTGISLAFAGGVMTSISFFELIPEAEFHSNLTITIAGMAAGAVLVLLLNFFLDKVTHTGEKPPKLHENYQEFYHESDLLARKSGMLRSGLLMLFAIAIHDIPEGLVIGAAGRHDIHFAAMLALMIAIHNIPEGMAIAAPLIAGGMNRWKAFLITVVEGIPSVLGAVVGVLVGGISSTALALSLAIAAGAMLYVVFGEMLPQSVVMSRSRVPTVVLLGGIVVGLLLTKL